MWLSEEAMAMAKKRTIRELQENGQIGYSEKLTFTNDGNLDGKEVLDGGGTTRAVRVYDIIDLHSVKKVIGFLSGQKVEFSAEELTVEATSDPGTVGVIGSVQWNGIGLVLTVAETNMFGCRAGTYLINVDGQNYVEYVETETIHPISDKYLPGVCLPVVEITSAEYSMENAVELSEKESARFTAAAEASLPVVVKFTLGSLPISVLAQFVGGAYIANMGDGMFNFGPSESGWAMGSAVD